MSSGGSDSPVEFSGGFNNFSPGTGNFLKTTVKYFARIDKNGVGNEDVIFKWDPICLIHLHMVHQFSVSAFIL